jgi:hypothetical protein
MDERHVELVTESERLRKFLYRWNGALTVTTQVVFET